MKFGIVSRYERSPVTFAAIHVAEALRPYGPVGFLTPTREPARLHATWDRRVVVASMATPFSEWLEREQPRVVVWTEAPTPAQVTWANNRGVLTVLLASCCEDDATVREVYPLFSRVVTPSSVAARLLIDHYRLNTVMVCPWSPSRAFTARPGGVLITPSVLVLAEGPLAQCVDPREAASCVRRLLRETRCPVGLLCEGTRRHGLRRFGVRDGRQPVIVTPRGCAETTAVLGSYDLVASLSRTDPYGTAALLSLHAGTPVAAYSSPPLEEIVLDWVNGRLIGEEAGVPPSKIFEENLLSLAADYRSVRELRMGTRVGLANRRLAFEQVWREIVCVVVH